MAEVALLIGGRNYVVACRDGGEDHLRRLAARVDAKVEEARAAVGISNEVRQLLFAALLLADEDNETIGAPTQGGDPRLGETLARLAARVEHIADALEGRPDNA